MRGVNGVETMRMAGKVRTLTGLGAYGVITLQVVMP